MTKEVSFNYKSPALSGGYVFAYRRDNPEERNNYFVDVYEFVMDVDESDIQLKTEETDGVELADLAHIRELAGEGRLLHYDSISRVFS